ncbi:hypothetical protein D9M68_721820 [compost metagenome]
MRAQPAMAKTDVLQEIQTLTAKSETLETAPKTQEPVTPAQDDNAEILKTLLNQAATCPPGTPIKLKDFAKSARIGNVRATAIFRQAEQLGRIKKTTIGYVAA